MRNPAGLDAFRLALHECGHPGGESPDFLEGLILVPPVYEVGQRATLPLDVASLIEFPEPNEPIRLIVRKRTKQDGIDHAEYRSVSADAQRQSDHRHDRKARPLIQCADAVTKVFQ